MGRGRQNQQDDRERLRYSEVLRMAHEKYTHGLNISALVQQRPTEENGMVAISEATVVGHRLSPDGDVIREVWVEWGDANPANVGRAIVPHILRMSNTRAKARALRDAVNRGEATEEELGGDAPASRTQRTPLMDEPEARPTPEESGAVRGGALNDAGSTGPTDSQKRALRKVVDQLGMTPDEFIEEFGRTSEMTAKRASEVIQILNKRNHERRPEPGGSEDG